MMIVRTKTPGERKNQQKRKVRTSKDGAFSSSFSSPILLRGSQTKCNARDHLIDKKMCSCVFVRECAHAHHSKSAATACLKNVHSTWRMRAHFSFRRLFRTPSSSLFSSQPQRVIFSLFRTAFVLHFPFSSLPLQHHSILTHKLHRFTRFVEVTRRRSILSLFHTPFVPHIPSSSLSFSRSPPTDH